MARQQSVSSQQGSQSGSGPLEGSAKSSAAGLALEAMALTPSQAHKQDQEAAESFGSGPSAEGQDRSLDVIHTGHRAFHNDVDMPNPPEDANPRDPLHIPHDHRSLQEQTSFPERAGDKGAAERETMPARPEVASDGPVKDRDIETDETALFPESPVPLFKEGHIPLASEPDAPHLDAGDAALVLNSAVSAPEQNFDDPLGDQKLPIGGETLPSDGGAPSDPTPDPNPNHAPEISIPDPVQTLSTKELRLEHQLVEDRVFPDLNERQKVDLDRVDGLDLQNLTLAYDHPVSVTFLSEGAGYKNSFGWYAIDEDGTFQSAELLFANASAKYSGGNLIGGESSVDLGDLPAGTQMGFFLIGNGYNRNKILRDIEKDGEGHFEFRNQAGEPATLHDDQPPRLVWVNDETGTETLIRGNIFHSTAKEETLSLNPDTLQHAVSGVDHENGKLVIGFEDLLNGGDKDYNDIIFEVDIGPANVRVLDPAIVSGDVDITDSDGDRMSQAAVALTEGAQIGDLLYISGYEITENDGRFMVGDTGLELIDGGFDPETGSLILRGEAEIDVYEDVLGAIKFANDREDVYGGDREIRFTVWDEKGAQSNLAPTVMHVDGPEAPPSAYREAPGSPGGEAEHFLQALDVLPRDDDAILTQADMTLLLTSEGESGAAAHDAGWMSDATALSETDPVWGGASDHHPSALETETGLEDVPIRSLPATDMIDPTLFRGMESHD